MARGACLLRVDDTLDMLRLAHERQRDGVARLGVSCRGYPVLFFPRVLAASRLPAFLLVGALVGCGAFVRLAALVRRTLLLCSARPAELVNVCYERNVG